LCVLAGVLPGPSRLDGSDVRSHGRPSGLQRRRSPLGPFTVEDRCARASLSPAHSAVAQRLERAGEAFQWLSGAQIDAGSKPAGAQCADHALLIGNDRDGDLRDSRACELVDG
jgi:hypothetical protein